VQDYVKEVAKVKKDNQEIELKLKNKEILAQSAPDLCGKFSKFKEEYEASKFCIEWNPHRKWLISNHIDIREFPEEIQFLKYLTKFSFKDKVYNARILRS
jgi:hypothetical protein